MGTDPTHPNGNGENALAEVDAAAASATFRRRAEDREEIAARNLAFAEFERRREGLPTADAFFAALDVYWRELGFLAVKRVSIRGAACGEPKP